jgi:CheY-like chemotaxis protein
VNLVSNAIKFTERGKVMVRVDVDAQSSTEVCLRFTVSDTGIGIPADKVGVIFEPFRQADGSTTRKYGGTGLGLAISGRLVRMLGGRVWVESEVDQGSQFHFTAHFALQRHLRLAAAEAPPEADDTIDGQVPRECLRILLAEDNTVNQRLAVRYLEKQGHAVAVVANGREVLTALEEESFDLVLMDLQMPEMGGFEATAHIREREQGTGRHLPIIALTAHAMKGDRERCLEAGMDGYLPKPVQGPQLLRAIADLLPAAPIEAPAASDRHALLAHLDGDEDLLREVAGLFLEDYPRLLEEIRAALTAGDAERLERAAHKLKGAVRNFSAGPALAAAQRLETLARQGDTAGREAAYRELEETLHQLRPALEALRLDASAV